MLENALPVRDAVLVSQQQEGSTSDSYLVIRNRNGCVVARTGHCHEAANPCAR